MPRQNVSPDSIAGRAHAMVNAAAPPELHPITARPHGSSVKASFGYAALISEWLSTAGSTSS